MTEAHPFRLILGLEKTSRLGSKAPAYTELLQQSTRLHFHSLKVSPQGGMSMNVHSTTGEVPSIRFEKVRKEGKSLFRPFALPKPYTSAKDVFCLRETRMVNGYRKISLSNHEIVVPHVPLREEVAVYQVPDVERGALEVRRWWKNRLAQSVTYPLTEFPRVQF